MKLKGRVRLDLVVSLAILIALVIANATVYSPKRRELDALARELDQTEQELRYVAGHSDALVRVAEYLPEQSEGAGDQRFLSGISSAIDRLGLSLNRVEPRGETPFGEYVKRSYKLQIEGDYEDFMDFMRYLEQLPDVAVIESFDYRSSVLSYGSDHRASLELSVIGY